MKATSFFKLTLVSIVLSSLVLLTGCGEEPKPKIKLKYIKRKCPNIITLHKPIRATPKEVKLPIKKSPENPDFYLVRKKELQEASRVSQTKSMIIKKQKRYIGFYERQNKKVRKVCGK